MKIAIIGTGGVGGYFGGRLAKAGNDVTFIARGDHFQAIKKKGLIVRSIMGDFHVQPANVKKDIHELENIELIILGVKAWQIKEIAGDLRNIITPKTLVLPLQNGVVAANELLQSLSEENVLNGLCFILSKIDAPGIIQHMGLEPSITLGELNNEQSERVKHIEDVLTHAGITAVVPADIQVQLWNKFIMICLSGLCAVARSPYGVIREHAETRQMMITLMEEIVQVGFAAGVNLEESIIAKVMDTVDGFAHDATSSMTRDIWEGKPSELEYLNGSVVKLGEKVGVKTPLNEFIYNCLLPLERLARNKIKE